MPQRRARRGRRRRGRAVDEVDPGRDPHDVRRARERGDGPQPLPRDGRLGDDGTGDRAVVGGARDGGGDEERVGERPPAGQVQGPGRDDPQLDEDARHALEQGAHAQLAHRGQHAPPVDLDEVAQDVRHRGGELDRPGRVDGGAEVAAEDGAGVPGIASPPARHGRAGDGDEGRAGHDERDDRPRGDVPRDDGGDGDDEGPDDDVDAAVDVEDEPVRVQAAGRHLPRGHAGEPVLTGLPAQHGEPGVEGDHVPPQRVHAQGRGEQEGHGHEARHEPGHGPPHLRRGAPVCSPCTTSPHSQPATAP